jgi:hypothetical protein
MKFLRNERRIDWNLIAWKLSVTENESGSENVDLCFCFSSNEVD